MRAANRGAVAYRDVDVYLLPLLDGHVFHGADRVFFLPTACALRRLVVFALRTDDRSVLLFGEDLAAVAVEIHTYCAASSCAWAILPTYLTYSFRTCLKSRAMSRSRKPIPMIALRVAWFGSLILNDYGYGGHRCTAGYMRYIPQHIVSRAVNHCVNERRNIFLWFHYNRTLRKRYQVVICERRVLGVSVAVEHDAQPVVGLEYLRG